MPRTIDDLTRDFRATQRGPLPDAVETILRHATTPDPRRSPAARRPLPRRRLALVPATCAAAGAVAAGILLWPGGGTGGGVLDRAAAAVAPADAILELRASVTEERLGPDGSWTLDGTSTVVSRALFEDDRNTRARFVSTGAGRPADDSGFVVADGGTVRFEALQPDGSVSAEAVPGDKVLSDFSLPGLLRDDYASGRMEVAERTGDTLMLRATAPPCATQTFFSEVVVDARTFRPRTAVSYDLCSAEEGRAPTAQERVTWRFDAVRSLPATPANIALLKVGG